MSKALKQIFVTGVVYIGILFLAWIIDYSGIVYTVSQPASVQSASVPFVEHLADSANQNTNDSDTDTANSSKVSDSTVIISPRYPFAEVIKVVDGDTIKVRTTVGTEEVLYTVRLIGINTPETVDPRRGVECFGKEASAFAKEVLMGKTIKLATDETQDRLDRYGRLLAYVYLPGETALQDTLFNLHIIKQGFAFEYTYEKPYIFRDSFKAAELQAREAGLGLWQEGVCQNNAMI